MMRDEGWRERSSSSIEMKVIEKREIDAGISSIEEMRSVVRKLSLSGKQRCHRRDVPV
jgi:hypothetical protein